MIYALFTVVLSTSAQAVEPPCPATGSGPIGSAHYCTDAAGNTTCTLVMDVPFVGQIETTVPAANEAECNDYVSASSNSPSIDRGQVAQSTRLRVEAPDLGADLLDLKACTAELSNARDRLDLLENALGIPEDFSYVVTEVTDAEGDPTELIIETNPKDDYKDILSISLMDCTLTSYQP